MSASIFDLLNQSAERQLGLRKGETLFRTGDPVHSLFLILEGEVALERTLESGDQLILQRAGAGALLAEASYFATTYHCDARALQVSQLAVVPIRNLRARAADEAVLLRALAEHLAREVRKARAMTEILSRKTVAARLDAWLALEGGQLPEKGQRRLLADTLAVTPEALYREIARRSGQ